MSSISTASNQPLGIVLQRAGLVSESQVQAALEEQGCSNRRIGEILADRGWLKQESADFFAEVWPWLQEEAFCKPLGQYLKQAALLEEAHIQTILQEQRQTQLKFGTLAILKGWVQRQTVNFFLEYLDSHQMDSSRQRAMIGDVTSASEAIRKKLLENETVNPFSLLLVYQGILEWGAVEADDSPEQAELLRIGLVVREHNMLRIARGLDPFLLDPQWVAQALDQLRPYNQIRLKLFKLSKNSEHPYQVLTAIQAWTGNQPDLTHILCQVIQETGQFIPAGEEAAQIEKLVQEHIIQDWQSGAAAEYLTGLCDRWLSNPSCQPQDLLSLYGRVLEEYEIPAEGDPAEQVLLALGLITENECTLSVANPIFRCIFNHHWLTREMQKVEVVSEEASDFARAEASSAPLLATTPNVLEELSVEETASFVSPLALEALDIALVDSNPVRSSSTLAEMGEELSAEEVASFLSPQEFKISDMPMVDNGGESASQVTPNANQELTAKTSSSQSAIATKPRRIGFWLAFGTAVTGILIAVGTQLWRQPSMKVSPVASSPEDAPASPQPEPEASSPVKNGERLSRADGESSDVADQLSPETTDRQPPMSIPTPSRRDDISFVISRSDPTVKVPIFPTGSTREQLLDSLGPPTWDRGGYYPDSRALFYEGIVPDRVDLGYLVSKATGELLQTEIAFAQSVSLETVQNTLRRLVRGKLPASVQERLRQVYHRQINQHTFALENWEGDIHRDDEGWIYIGIWDADFH